MEYTAWGNIIDRARNFEMERGLTSFVNPYSMLALEGYNDITEHIDFWHVDGISLVHSLNKFKNLNLKRISFDDSSIAPYVFNYAKKNNLKIAIIGSKEKYIEKFVKKIATDFDLEIDYYRNGYFGNNLERNSCFDTIITRNIEVVICGMGTPLQERFLIDLKNLGWSGYGYTCGGYIHQTAKKGSSYYPNIINKLHLRSIYRMIDEPRLVKRYLIDYAKFFLKLYLFKNKRPNKQFIETYSEELA